MASVQRKEKRAVEKVNKKLSALIYNMMIFAKKTDVTALEIKVKYQNSHKKWREICKEYGLSKDSENLFKDNIDAIWAKSKKSTKKD